MCLDGVEIKSDCAVEDQQKFACAEFRLFISRLGEYRKKEIVKNKDISKIS
jgi:hypothetical protein